MFFTTTCDIYRPFGDATPTTVAAACRLVPDLANGMRFAGPLAWTHYVDLPIEVDVVDGGTRAEGSSEISFADGDELRVPSGGTARYVVVWVEDHNVGATRPFRRAYLTRHSTTLD